MSEYSTWEVNTCELALPASWWHLYCQSLDLTACYFHECFGDHFVEPLHVVVFFHSYGVCEEVVPTSLYNHLCFFYVSLGVLSSFDGCQSSSLFVEVLSSVVHWMRSLIKVLAYGLAPVTIHSILASVSIPSCSWSLYLLSFALTTSITTFLSHFMRSQSIDVLATISTLSFRLLIRLQKLSEYIQ